MWVFVDTAERIGSLQPRDVATSRNKPARLGRGDAFVEMCKRQDTRCAAYPALRWLVPWSAMFGLPVRGVCERCQMMNIYVILFFLLPFGGMICAVVVLAREKRARSHQRHLGLR
jgi:hypothetical protein